MNQHGSGLKTYLEKVLPYGQFDGKQYAIPAKRIIVARFGTFVREDWLKKLNMQAPATVDEFENMLKAFKAQNPGNVNGVIPFTLTSDVGNLASNLLEAFIKRPVSDQDRYINSTASTQAGLFLPGFKDGVKFLNKLYNEGLLSPNFALDKDGKLLEQSAINGTLGSYCHNYDHPIRNIPGININLAKNVQGARFIPIDPFANLYTGKTEKLQYAPNGLYNIVPKSSKHVNEAIKYLNWMTDKNVLFFLQYGNEGIGHTMVDGIPKVLTPTGEQMFNSLQNIDYTLIVNGADLGSDELNMKAQALTYPGGEDLYPACYELAMKNSFPPVQLSKPTNADIKYSNTLTEKEKELYAKCITCKPADFDSMWETMTKEYLQAGGQQTIDDRKALWAEEHK